MSAERTGQTNRKLNKAAIFAVTLLLSAIGLMFWTYSQTQSGESSVTSAQPEESTNTQRVDSPTPAIADPEPIHESQLLSNNPDFQVLVHPSKALKPEEFLDRFSPVFHARLAAFEEKNSQISDSQLRDAARSDFDHAQDSTVWKQADQNFVVGRREFFADNREAWIPLADFQRYETSEKTLYFQASELSFLQQYTHLSIPISLVEADQIFSKFRSLYADKIRTNAESTQAFRNDLSKHGEIPYLSWEDILRREESGLRENNIALVAVGDVDRKIWEKAFVVDKPTNEILFTVQPDGLRVLNSLEWPDSERPSVSFTQR